MLNLQNARNPIHSPLNNLPVILNPFGHSETLAPLPGPLGWEHAGLV